MEEPIMAYRPNDPYRSPDDPYLAADDRASRLEREAQMDPELAEGPPSGGKVAAFAIAIALVLGAVFYGLNNTSINHAGTTPTSSTAQNSQSSPPAAPPGMRDVTPRPNTDKGVTPGAAPAQPQPAPSRAPNPTPPGEYREHR
jgi:hypothetical protein